MEEWARKLRRSGYPATFRHQVIKAAVDKWEKMCKDDDEGVRPVHRAREWQLAARRLEKERRREDWYKAEGDQISAPLIISPTAGSLTADIRTVCDKYHKSTGIRVAIRTRAGQPMRGDPKPEPFRRAGCDRVTCLVCSGGEKGNCEKNGSGYRISCRRCENEGKKVIYEGETGKNPHSRGLDHQDGLRLEHEENPLWKHCTLEHGGEKVEFKMKALRSFKSCLLRQVNEAVRISSSRADIMLNSKSEFHQAPLTRLVAYRGLHGDQGEDQGRVSLAAGGSRGQGGGRS